MALITQQTTAVTGNTITAAIWNTEFSNILNDYNGGITNANISASAGIAYSKLSLTGAILNADLAGSIATSKISGTAVTLAGSETLTNKTLTSPTINTPTINDAVVNNSRCPITTSTPSGSYQFDLGASNHFLITMSQNTAFTVTGAGNGQAFIVHLKQAGGGSKLASWFSGILWAGGSTPTLTTTSGKTDSFGFIYDGTSYYGYIIGQNI